MIFRFNWVIFRFKILIFGECHDWFECGIPRTGSSMGFMLQLCWYNSLSFNHIQCAHDHGIGRSNQALRSKYNSKKMANLHPGRLTWNIIIGVWKMMFLFNWVIFRFQPLIFLMVSLIVSSVGGLTDLFLEWPFQESSVLIGGFSGRSFPEDPCMYGIFTYMNGWFLW